MGNKLNGSNSPYLLAHAENPVNWYPWGKEALDKAAKEGKPIFLSIGYSTCHWCHVMAEESFENRDIADILNAFFISIKVDREERPDIDGVYMRACQAMTGGGGWPASLFLTPEGKPFYAGTYFPPQGSGNIRGFTELLLIIADKWANDRGHLEEVAENISGYLANEDERVNESSNTDTKANISVKVEDLCHLAFRDFEASFDHYFGGFGDAPKFPAPHNLLFLMKYSYFTKNGKAMEMAVKTLTQMRKGGIFDHIGGGFCRYSTDREYLVPHFEKMLYDNALLISAYSTAYSLCGRMIYLDTAKRTAEYLLREMQSPSGGFYGAQDADSEGGEGLFYLFEYDEVLEVLGEDRGERFCDYFSVTPGGNFEKKNIPNRLHDEIETGNPFSAELETLYNYRRSRMKLAVDDKILTSWNALVISAFCDLYRASGEEIYLETACKTADFILQNLSHEGMLFVGLREGELSGKAFLEDYAYLSSALISLYGVCGDLQYLNMAERYAAGAISQFYDSARGGFFRSGTENEELFIKFKETYDGAVPCGNSVMYFVLEKLARIGKNDAFPGFAREQLDFLSEKSEYPIGISAFLGAALYLMDPQVNITVVLDKMDCAEKVVKVLPFFSDIKIVKGESAEYPLKNGKTTYYICENKTCRPPVNEPDFIKTEVFV